MLGSRRGAWLWGIGFAVVAAGCGTSGGGGAWIPAREGEPREALALDASPDELARRAATERVAMRLDQAERFARRALAMRPEHPGALVEAARIALGRAAGKRGAEAAVELGVARRLYAQAARVATEKGASEAIAEERAAALVAAIRAELEVDGPGLPGRVAAASALLAELEEELPGRARVERAELHGQIADVWLARGLAGPGRAATEAAQRAGAGEGATRWRMTQVAFLAQLAQPQPNAAELAASSERRRRELEAALGERAEAWTRAAIWLGGLAPMAAVVDAGAALWAAERAVALDGEAAAAWSALARIRGQAGQWESARAAWLEGARRVGGIEGARLLAAGLSELQLLAEPAEVEPVREALAAAMGSIEPAAWREAVAIAEGVGEWAMVVTIAARARAKGEALAALVEIGGRLERGGEAARAELDAAFDVAITRLPAEDGPAWLELGRRLVQVRDGGRLAAAAKRLDKAAGREAERLWLEAAQALVAGDAGRAREIITAEARTGAGVLRARAHWGRYADALTDAPAWAFEAARSWAEVAPAEERGVALRELLGAGLQRSRGSVGHLVAEARTWLASELTTAAFGGQEQSDTTGWERFNAARAERDLIAALAAQTRLPDDVRADALRLLVASGYVSRGDELVTLLTRLERDAELEAALVARASRAADPGAEVEGLAERARQEQRVQAASSLFARLHPAEIDRLDVLPELARLRLSLGEPRLARADARALLEHARAGRGVSAGRLVALGDAMLENGEDALAAQAFELAVEAGDRSSKAMFGWLRAIARRGDEAAMDAIANRWLDARQRRDARASDELAKVLLEVGRLDRAIEVLEGRLTPGERVEPALFGTLAELYRLAARPEPLERLARAFVEGDQRGSQRAVVTAGQRLVEAGAHGAARSLVTAALAQRPRDAGLLSAALSLATALAPEEVEDLARRLLEVSGTSWEVWERVIADVRASGSPQAAMRLVDQGLARFAGEPRLLIVKGRLALLAGEPDRALEAFDDAVARTDDPRASALAIEPFLMDALMPERVAALHTRALALVPGRADLTMGLARALLAAQRPQEAEQLLLRFLAETDRGHGVIAEVWSKAGYSSRALDHWARAFDQLGSAEVAAAYETVAQTLARSGEGERLETFTRLYLQALRGAEPPPLMPIAKAFTAAGRPDEARRWLDEADARQPTAEVALARLDAHLARGERDDARRAGLTFISRRAAAVPAGRPLPPAIGAALDELVARVLAAGAPALALGLVDEVESLHGASAYTRLIGARVALHAEGLGSALARAEGPMPSWRGNRELLQPLRALIEDLLAAGHAHAAQGLMTRALRSGSERELLLAAVRVAARAGYPELAELAAQRAATEMPALNAWLAADTLLAEGLPRLAHDVAGRALALGLQGASLQRALLVHAWSGGSPGAALDRAPRLAQPGVERRLAEAQLALQAPLARPDELARAARVVAPTLTQAAPDPALVKQVLVAAALDPELGALREVLDVLARQNTDRAKLWRQSGADLAASGQARGAVEAFGRALRLDPGDLRLLQQAFESALAAGADGLAEAWAGPSLAAVENTPQLARAELARLAAVHLRPELAASLLAPVSSSARASVEAEIALARGDLQALVDLGGRAAMAAPDEARARIELARLVLATTPATDLAAARAAASLLAPLLTEEGAPELALVLGLAASLRGAALPRSLSALSAEHARRFPGPPAEIGMLVDAAITAGPAALETILRRLTPAQRGAALTDALRVRRELGVSVGAELRPVLEAAAVDAALAPEVAIEVALAFGVPERARIVAVAAVARAPDRDMAASSLARVLAETGLSGDLDEALRLAIERVGRTRRGGIYEAEARLLQPAVALDAWETLTRVAAIHGRGELARVALARALASQPPPDRLVALRLLQATRLEVPPAERRGALGECVARAIAPWSGACRQALAR